MEPIIRNITRDDYDHGYLELLFELTHYNSTYSKEYFCKYLENEQCCIQVIEYDSKIIGAGSLFILNKLHCNPFGQIEDVVITEKYRGLGLGKKMIERLISIAKERGCYKVVLNSLNHNKSFYLACGFTESGVQFVKRL